MPADSSTSSSSRLDAVFTLARTRSGPAASRVSSEGDLIAPRLATSSPRPRSKLVHASSAAATSVSRPPARHQTSANEPMSAATRCGASLTVTLRPRSSVNPKDASVSASCAAGPQAAKVRASIMAAVIAVILLIVKRKGAKFCPQKDKVFVHLFQMAASEIPLL